jgi:hypothetical protein
VRSSSANATERFLDREPALEAEDESEDGWFWHGEPEIAEEEEDMTEEELAQKRRAQKIEAQQAAPTNIKEVVAQLHLCRRNRIAV